MFIYLGLLAAAVSHLCITKSRIKRFQCFKNKTLALGYLETQTSTYIYMINAYNGKVR
jgi:hypothetical protein